MNGLKLFKVDHPKLDTKYFYAKAGAKLLRDKYIADKVSATVKRGPDHWRGET